MVGRLDRANGLLVSHAIVIDKGLVEAHEGVTDFRQAWRIRGCGCRVGEHFLGCAVRLCNRARRNKPLSFPRLHLKNVRGDRARRHLAPSLRLSGSSRKLQMRFSRANRLQQRKAFGTDRFFGRVGILDWWTLKGHLASVGRLTLGDKASIFARNSFLMSLTQTRTWPQKTIIY